MAVTPLAIQGDIAPWLSGMEVAMVEDVKRCGVVQAAPEPREAQIVPRATQRRSVLEREGRGGQLSYESS
jgi:hypothetical protein